MSPSVTIGILAEFEPASEPHHATNEALRHAADPLGVDLAYGAAAATEELRCGFGLNPESRERLEQSPLRVVGSSEDDAVRIVELPDPPFYLATLFLPQRASRAGRPHPLVVAFLKATCEVWLSRTGAARSRNN